MVSPKSLTIYIEGGAKGTLAKEAREMFGRFLKDKCGVKRQPRLEFCGSREVAFRKKS